jgi:Leucine-rich repeat (LRR) protein
LEEREQDLLREHRANWLPKNCDALSFTFRRGFVERVEILREQFLTSADRLFDQAPIRHLHLRGDRGLQYTIETSNSAWAWIASSRHLANLRGLSLTDLTWRSRAIRDFLESPSLRQLAELQLSRLQIINEHEGGWDDYGDVPDLPRLKRLDISHNALPPGVLPLLPIAILSSCMSELVSLNLAHTALTLGDLRAVCESFSLPALHELNLNGNRLTHEAVSVLGQGQLLSQLETLHLSSNLLGDAGALMIRDWPSATRLTRLGLGHNQIFGSGAQALAKAQALDELVSLDLFGNISCDSGVAALASSFHLSQLRTLNLRFNGVGDKGVRALARSQALDKLTWLNLTANRITSRGARALSKSPKLSSLVRLDLPRNDIAPREQEMLRQRFGPFVTC